ncbi:MAG: response regulator [Spirochaetales bacterium]|nr:response regulator [Spirochaetales bacterium]
MAKILIVDDDHDFVEATKNILESRGHSVVAAFDGTSGYGLAVKEHPDLICLDVMMKHDREGFEIARKLHGDQATNKIPVIIITGVRKEKNLPFAFEPDPDWLPVKAVLEKPVTPSDLLEAVDSVF